MDRLSKPDYLPHENDQVRLGVTLPMQSILQIPKDPLSHDYVSPGFQVITPDAAFPNMVLGDRNLPRWPWFRGWVPHNWYVDRRNPEVGFASRDEVSILYNNALLFRGKPCLEIGCWRGWSAVHIALGSGHLDIIDPLFADPEFREGVADTFRMSGIINDVKLHAGSSPEAFSALAQATGKRWSLIFIDGDHEGSAPRLDAEIAMKYAADTAMILFHDLASPHVAAGLDALRMAGWNTMVYQTMQIMGVAWRGDVEPVCHIPDPEVFWTLPSHLSGYAVSRWAPPNSATDLTKWPSMMTPEERVSAALVRTQTAFDERNAAIVECDQQRSRADHLSSLQKRLEDEVVTLTEDVQLLQASLDSVPIVATMRRNAIFEFARWFVNRRVLFGLLRRSPTQRKTAIYQYLGSSDLGILLQESHLKWLIDNRVLLGLLRRSNATRLSLVSFYLLQARLDLDTNIQRNNSRYSYDRENIIVVVHECSRTGAPILGWNIAKRLAERYNIFTVTLRGGALVKEFKHLSAEVYGPFPESELRPEKLEASLSWLFHNKKFRYAIVNSTESRLLLEVFSRRKIETLFLVHEFGAYVYPAADLCKAFNSATEIVFPARIVAQSSEAVCPSLKDRRTWILAQGKSELPSADNIVKPKISAEIFELSKARANGSFIVLGAGSVNFRKGVDLFLATAAATLRRNPSRPIHFVWVGHGYNPREDMGYSIYLEEQLQRSSIEGNVTLLEEVADLEPIYDLMDAFLLTSRLDPLPNVSIDAAQRGIPLVCFDEASGIAELMKTDLVTASVVVPYLDIDAAARALINLASHEEERKRIANATRHLSNVSFNMETYVEKLDEIGRSLRY